VLRARLGGPELPAGVVDHCGHQGLLGREVVMDGGVVDADLGGHVAQPQALEPALRDTPVGRLDQRLPPVLAYSRLTTRLSHTRNSTKWLVECQMVSTGYPRQR